MKKNIERYRYRTSKLFVLPFLIIQFSCLYGQSFDLNDILYGNIETYKKYDIKKLTFKNDGEILKSISIYPDSNKLSIVDPNSQYDYYYDEKHRPIFIIKKNKKISIKYSEDGSIIQSQSLKITDSIYERNYRTTFFDTAHLHTENNLWFSVNKVTLDTIDKRQINWIANEKDSLLSYVERINDCRELREYVNRIRVRTTFLNHYNLFSASILTTEKYINSMLNLLKFITLVECNFKTHSPG